LKHLSEEALKGDPACRTAFFAGVQRGAMSAFEFAIRGSFDSSGDVAGTFVPTDAIRYPFTSFFSETISAGGRAWTTKSWPPQTWTEAPEKREAIEKIKTSLFPPAQDVGNVRCLGKVSMDDRDYDAYEYDFYQDSESAKTLDSHRSMLVDSAS